MSLRVIGLKAETLNACDSSLSALFHPFDDTELRAIRQDPQVCFYADAIRDLDTYGRLYANKPDFLADKLRRINNLISTINCEYDVLYLIDFQEMHRQKMILRRMRHGIRRAVRAAKARRDEDVDFDPYAVY